MRRDDSEIIEVFDTDDVVVGGGFDSTKLGWTEYRGVSTDDTVTGGESAVDEPDGDTERRRRWVIPAGVTALVAVVAVGITTGSDNQNAATPRTTPGDSVASAPITLATLPPTTVSDSAATVGSRPLGQSGPDGPAPRYVVDVPEGYAVLSADTGQIGTQNATYSQLWATPGASRRTGSWVTISRSTYFDRGYQQTQLRDNTYTIRLDGSAAFVTLPTLPDSVGNVTVLRDDATITVEGFGVSSVDLIAIAAAVGSDPAAPFGSAGGPPVLDGFTKLIDAGDYWGNTNADGQWAQMYAADTATDPETGQNAVLYIETAPPSESFAAALPFLLDSITPFTAADGSIGIAGSSGTAPATAQAHWVDPAGWAVSVYVEGDIADAIATARSAHIADDAEWGSIVTVFTPEPNQLTFDRAAVALLTFGDGSTAEITLDRQGSEYSWSVLISDPEVPEYGSSGFTASARVDAPHIVVLASLERTFVLANVPTATTGATLTVYPSTGSPISTTLVEVDPLFTVRAATLTFEQVGAFTATVTAADGTVLAVWPAQPDL